MEYNKPEMEIVKFKEDILTDLEMTSGPVDWENPNIDVNKKSTDVEL